MRGTKHKIHAFRSSILPAGVLTLIAATPTVVGCFGGNKTREGQSTAVKTEGAENESVAKDVGTALELAPDSRYNWTLTRGGRALSGAQSHTIDGLTYTCASDSDKLKHACFLSTAILEQDGITREIGPQVNVWHMTNGTKGFNYHTQDSFDITIYNATPWFSLCDAFSHAVSGNQGGLKFNSVCSYQDGEGRFVTNEWWEELSFNGSLEQVQNPDGSCTRTIRNKGECWLQWAKSTVKRPGTVDEVHGGGEPGKAYCTDTPQTTTDANVACISNPHEAAQILWMPTGSNPKIAINFPNPLTVTGTTLLQKKKMSAPLKTTFSQHHPTPKWKG